MPNRRAAHRRILRLEWRRATVIDYVGIAVLLIIVLMALLSLAWFAAARRFDENFRPETVRARPHSGTTQRACPSGRSSADTWALVPAGPRQFVLVAEPQPAAFDAAGLHVAGGAVVGRAGNERAQALWGRETMAGMAHGGLAQGNRVDGEAGCGLPVGSRFVETPRVGFATSVYGRDYRLGCSLGALDRESLAFELGVDAQRRESPLQGDTDNGARGRATVRR